MKLTTITLENYRCYESLEIELHPKTTVLVANNGQGKTAILDAIRVALWPYVSQFDLAKGAFVDPATTITIDDVRTIKSCDSTASAALGVLDKMARQMPSSIEAKGDYGEGGISWKRYRDSEATKSQTKEDKACRDLKACAKQLQKNVRNLKEAPISLPVFGYYGTGRLWKEKRLTNRKKGTTEKNNEQIRTFAYRDCLDPASSFRQFEDWFTLAYMEIKFHQVSQSEQDATFLAIDSALKCPVKVVQDAVNEVLKPVGWKDLQFSQRDQSLVLKHENYGVMKVSQLSDGIKNMLAMVADIAYRCVLLNGHLGATAATESTGIVMIDEVDMHLHPQWQQTVIGSLQAAFPNIQFVLTTHSPQVLSTVPKECIRVLGINAEGDGIAAIPLAASYGEPSNDVLQAVMQVDPQPPVPEKALLDELTRLVDQGKYQSKHAVQLLNKLKQKLNNQHPQIQKIERSIRRQEGLKG